MLQSSLLALAVPVQSSLPQSGQSGLLDSALQVELTATINEAFSTSFSALKQQVDESLQAAFSLPVANEEEESAVAKQLEQLADEELSKGLCTSTFVKCDKVSKLYHSQLGGVSFLTDSLDFVAQKCLEWALREEKRLACPYKRTQVQCVNSLLTRQKHTLSKGMLVSVNKTILIYMSQEKKRMQNRSETTHPALTDRDMLHILTCIAHHHGDKLASHKMQHLAKTTLNKTIGHRTVEIKWIVTASWRRQMQANSKTGGNMVGGMGCSSVCMKAKGIQQWDFAFMRTNG